MSGSMMVRPKHSLLLSSGHPDQSDNLIHFRRLSVLAPRGTSETTTTASVSQILMKDVHVRDISFLRYFLRCDMITGPWPISYLGARGVDSGGL